MQSQQNLCRLFGKNWETVSEIYMGLQGSRRAKAVLKKNHRLTDGENRLVVAKARLGWVMG